MRAALVCTPLLALTVVIALLVAPLPALAQEASGAPADFDPAAMESNPLLANVQTIATGVSHNCALMRAGAVLCWGWNEFGELGNGSTLSSAAPVRVLGLDRGVVALAVGASHACALLDGGDVRCWGSNTYGQLGDGTQTNRLMPTDVLGLPHNVAALAAGGYSTCALTTTGGVLCWGVNTHGQIGDGTTTYRPAPVAVKGLAGAVRSIAVGASYVCVLYTSEGVACWGWNAEGQLGDGTQTDRSVPAAVVGLSDGVTGISAGTAHTCAITVTGAAKCWGANFGGQLGVPVARAYDQRSTPVQVTGLTQGVAEISAGWGHTCARMASGGMKCWGLNSHGPLGDGTLVSRSLPQDVVGFSSGVAAISAGYAHTCAVTTAGGAKCWGWNGRGLLGIGVTPDTSIPVTSTDRVGVVQAMTAGRYRTCVLTDVGGVKCSGYNAYGEVGDDTTDERLLPVDVLGLSEGARAIDAGSAHTCAVTSLGGVKCWGVNWNGALGDGSYMNPFHPVDVVGLSTGVQAVSAGLAHTCALLQTGGVQCWGQNGNGELGDGTQTDSSVPVAVTGLSSGVAAVAAGAAFSCILTTAGRVQCWGGNNDGELGDGTQSRRLTPGDVVGLPGAMRAIAAGYAHACALTPTGGVKCWGFNQSGQLGNGNTTIFANPLPVDVVGLQSGVKALALGGYHTCALTNGGAVFCWGLNHAGQLGVGDHTDRATPTLVHGFPVPVVEIAAGETHTCARLQTGRLMCWGESFSGELMIEPQWLPANVVAPVPTFYQFLPAMAR